jgi:hypothetical protein
MAAWAPSIPTLTEWVAVLRVAATAAELDRDAESLLHSVPDHGLLGTVDAHVGLAERLEVSPETWVSGVVAETRAALDEALIRVAGDGPAPLVVGRFRVRRLSE